MKVAITSIFIFLAAWLSAQNVGIKSNLLNDALLNPNIGVEVQVAPKWSVELVGEVNAWTLSHQRRWKHWLLMPEARYWLCDPMVGHFFGAHLIGQQYNIGRLYGLSNFLGNDFGKLRDSRYQGWAIGAGLAYGYSWVLGRHWNFEAEIGIGYEYTRYDRYPCATCGTAIEKGKSHNYFGPTKAALNLVYIF